MMGIALLLSSLAFPRPTIEVVGVVSREQAARQLAKSKGLPYSMAHKLLREWEKRENIRFADGLEIPTDSKVHFVELKGSTPLVTDHGFVYPFSPYSKEGRKWLEEVARQKGTPGYEYFIKNFAEALERGTFPYAQARVRKRARWTRTGPQHRDVLVLGVQFPECRDGWRTGNVYAPAIHPKVQGLVHGPSPITFRTHFYRFILDPTNPNSVRNYWYTESHGRIRLEGTESDVRGWVHSPHPLGDPSQLPPWIRFPDGTLWKNPLGSTSTTGWICSYCYYTHNHRVTTDEWDDEARAIGMPLGFPYPYYGGFWALAKSAGGALWKKAQHLYDGDGNGHPFYDNDWDGKYTWEDLTPPGDEPLDPKWARPADDVRHKRGPWPVPAPAPYDHDSEDDHNYPTGGVFGGEPPHSIRWLIWCISQLVEDKKFVNPTIDLDNYDHVILITPHPAGPWRGMHVLTPPVAIGAPGKWCHVWEDGSLGMYAHETGHSICGLPDLYDLDRYPGRNPSGLDFISEGLGAWSLMAAGIRLDAWSKIFGGYIDPVVVAPKGLFPGGFDPEGFKVDIEGDVINAQLPYIEDPLREPVVYKVWGCSLNPENNQPREYWLIENHNAHRFGDYTPFGMLIYHVDTMRVNEGGGGGTPDPYGFLTGDSTPVGNEDEDFYGCALEQADGKFELERSPGPPPHVRTKREKTSPRLELEGTPGPLMAVIDPVEALLRAVRKTRQGGLHGDPWPCPASFHALFDGKAINYGPYGTRAQNDLFTHWTSPDVKDHYAHDSFVRITNISSKGSLMTCNIYVTPRKLLIQAEDISPEKAPQGARDKGMLKLTFTLPRFINDPRLTDSAHYAQVEQAEEVRITSLTLCESGSSKNDADVERVKLYADDGDGKFDPSKDTLIAEGTFKKQYCTLTGFTLVVPREDKGGSKVLFIAYDISLTAQTRPAITLGAEISEIFYFKVPEYVAIDPKNFPLRTMTTSLSHVLVTEAVDTLTVRLVDLAPETVSQGTDTALVDGKPINRVPMVQLALSVNQDSVAVQRLRIRKSGSASDIDVEAVRLYWDKNGNSRLDAADPLVQSVSFKAGVATFDNFSVFGVQGLLVSEGNSVYLLVVYDISDTAEPGKTIGAAIRPYNSGSPPESDVIPVDPNDSVAPDQLLSSTESLIQRAVHTLQVHFHDMAPISLEPDDDPCPTGSIYYTSRGARMAKLVLTPLSGKITVGSLRVRLIGDAVPSEDIYEIKVYKDDDGNDIPDTPDKPLASQPGSAFREGSVLLDLSPDVEILARSSTQLLVVIDIAKGARVGRQMSVSFQSPTDIDVRPDSISATLPWNSTLGTIRGYLNASGGSLAPPKAEQGATDVPFLYLDLQSAPNQNGLANDLYLTQIGFDQTATATDTDIKAAHLYLDDGDKNFEPGPGGDTKLASSTQREGRVIFNLTLLEKGALKVEGGQTVRLFMSADISLFATPGHKVMYQVMTASSIYGPGVIVKGTFPIPSSPATEIVDAPDTLVVAPEDLLLKDAFRVNDRYFVQPGATLLPVATLRFSVQGDSSTVAQVRLDRAGTPGEDEDVPQVIIYDDRNLNGQVDPKDVLLAQGSFTGGKLMVNLANFSVTHDRERQLIIFFNVANYNQNEDVKGHKVGLYIGDPKTYFTLADAVDSAQWKGGAKEFSTVQAEVTDFLSIQARSLSPSVIEPGQENVPMLRLSLTARTGSVKVTSLTLKHEGEKIWGSKPSDVREVRIYHDTNMDDKIDGDPSVGSGVFDLATGEVTINLSPPITVSAGAEKRLIIAFCIQGVKYNTTYNRGGKVAAKVTRIGLSFGILDPAVALPILSDLAQIADKVPPRLLSATAEDNVHVLLIFDEEVEGATATNPAHYEISPPLEVTKALRVNPTEVRLITSPQTKDQTYIVTVSGVRDIARNEMTLWENPPLSDPSARRAQFSGADAVPPRVVKAYAEDGRHAVVEFSKPVHRREAETIANYTISPVLKLLSADLFKPSKVRLKTDRQKPQTLYTITVSKIRDVDAAGNPVNPIDPDHDTAQFIGANIAPTLSNPSLTDNFGDTGDGIGVRETTFTFKVTYTDRENDKPSYVRLVLDGVPHTMMKEDPKDTDYADGVVYQISRSNLEPGRHQYYFEASDEMGATTRLPHTGEHIGPIVNLAPLLTKGSVQPESGSRVTSFIFSVTYTDLDNNAPQFVKVVIDGKEHYMQKADPKDTNYTDGTTYKFETTLGIGRHQFYFEASDGIEATRLPKQGEFTGPTVANLPPVLDYASFEPAKGTEETFFSFRVTYRDLDNDSPKFKDPKTGQIEEGVALVLNPGTASPRAIALQKENPQDTDYTDGALFVGRVKGSEIGAGRHTFRFEATDSTDTAQFPKTGELLTLIVRGALSISLNLPSEASLGQRLSTVGSLKPAVGGLPVKVTVRKPTLPGEGKTPEPAVFNLTSDREGKFSLELFLDRTGDWSIKASFAGMEEWSPAEAEGKVSVKPLEQTFGIGLHLMSVPFRPVDGRPGAVLGLERWRVARWLPEQGRYGMDDEAGEFALGLGFWLKAERALTVRADGSLPSPREIRVVRLIPGWNMIGCPYVEPTDWSRAQVRVGMEVLSLAGAAKKGWLSSYGWAYEPGVGYVLVHERAAGAINQLEPWRGYWVKAGASCELLLPLPGTRAATAKEAQRARSLREWAGGEGWLAQLVAQAGELKDTFNFFGVSPAVRATPQDYLFETPPMPSPFVDLSFIRPDMRGERFATDVRAWESDPATFEFEVRTDLPNTEVVVTWPNLASVPNKFALILEDLSTGRKVYMRTSGSYTFRSGPEGASRPFRLKVASSIVEGRLRIFSLRTVRTRGGLVIQFELTKPAAVTAEVRTSSGRLVGRVVTDMPLQPGLVRLPWDGKDSSGRKAPAGVYLVKVVARDDMGAIVRAMQTTVKLP